MILAFAPASESPDRAMSQDAEFLRDFAAEHIAPAASDAVHVDAFLELSTVIQDADAHVDPFTVYYGVLLLNMLPDHIPAPEVSVTPRGELVFDWISTRRVMFSVAIGKDGLLSYAGLFGRESKVHGAERFMGTIPKAILDNFKRLPFSSTGNKER